MGRIRQTVKRRFRKSNTLLDSKGRRHCKTCGAFISGRGKGK